MDLGNWVPLDKNLITTLPTDRPLSEIEAIFTMQFDIDSYGKLKPVRYYENQWGWYFSKTQRFIKKVNQKRIKNESKVNQSIHIIIGNNKQKRIKSESKVNQESIQYIEPRTRTLEPKEEKYIEFEKFPGIKIHQHELEKLKLEFTDWEDRIEKLWLYIGSKGVKYKSHYITILSWAKKNGERKPSSKKQRTPQEQELWEQELIGQLDKEGRLGSYDATKNNSVSAEGI
jgi:hypothetical protein